MSIPTHFELKRPIYKIHFLEPIPEHFKRENPNFRLYPVTKAVSFVSHSSLKSLESTDIKFEVAEELAPEKAHTKVAFSLKAVLHEIPPNEVCEEIVALALSRKAKGERSNPIYVGRTAEELPDSFVLDRPGGRRRYRWVWNRRKTPRKMVSFEDRFPRLIEAVTDPDTRFVVSLGAGGLRMFAHPSIFRLIRALGVESAIEEIWGCSGGAIAGLAYALGADHQILEQEGFHLYHRKYDLTLSPSAPTVIKNLIIDHLFPGTRLSLDGFVDVQNAVQALLARVALYNKPSIPFYAIAYNLSLKRNEVLTPTKVNSKAYDGRIKYCSPINAVLASAAIPVLFVPKIIKRGQTQFTYIDGSLFEEVPLTSVYHKWQMDKKNRTTKKKKLFILAINLFPYFSTWKFFFTRYLVKFLPLLEFAGILARLADLVRRTRIDDQIQTINEDRNAYVAEINLPLLSKVNFLDPKIIPMVIDKARGSFFDQLVKLEARLRAEDQPRK